MNLQFLNDATSQIAHEILLQCLGVSTWAKSMVASRPFASEAAVYATADKFCDGLETAEWLEAFTHHPKIGDLDGLRKKFKSTAHLAGSEQSGVNQATEVVLTQLAAGNKAYEAKFGFIFIVCATGKTAAEMLALLQQRLPHSKDRELQIAAAEQRKITRLRLAKLGDP